ncbi:MAG: 6,7-dimethyl-8-ribityllumazine synthase [Phycisphaeraceae bacterium]|nr:MAG: 6,7-dimethyl-8-ribityllumazine synthase [Phycisphaeraceae bacterium]
MKESPEIAIPEPGGPPAVCVVVSRYNGSITARMREAAEATFRARVGDGGEIAFIDAPGTFELAALTAAAIDTGLYDGVVALGCVIKGETDHDKYISQAVADALAILPVQTGIPVAFGVITAGTPQQAAARAGGEKGNKGAEAMDALLDTIAAMTHLAESADRGERASFSLDRAATDKADSESGEN